MFAQHHHLHLHRHHRHTNWRNDRQEDQRPPRPRSPSRSWLCGPLALIAKVCLFAAICGGSPQSAAGQIEYKGHLSTLRIRELHHISKRLEYALNSEKFDCGSYYDYVCSRDQALYSVMGHLPEFSELIQLLRELQEDPEQFAAKQKLMDFFISCNTLKSLEQCYFESFEYFKPIFGYIIAKNHIDKSAHEYVNFLGVLDRFLNNSEHVENFHRNPIRVRLLMLRQKFGKPEKYFGARDLDNEYSALMIYRESYRHNLRQLEQHRRRNSTYETGIQRTMLDWSLYVYQSRNKPMSFYYATLNVHLWMTLYNSTEHQRDAKYFGDIGECLQLPQFVNVLEEARILAVVYLKSFHKGWKEYEEWVESSTVNRETNNQENQLLKTYGLSNRQLFFVLYAQNFCNFGKQIAENVFYLGLRYNQEFYNVYSCSPPLEVTKLCV